MTDKLTDLERAMQHLEDVVRIVTAISFTTKLGPTQQKRLDAARAALRNYNG